MKKPPFLPSLFLSTLSALSLSAQADALLDMINQGHADADLRYRVESVSQDNALKDARASTARLRAGYETGDYHGIYVDGSVQSLGVVGQDFYNSTNNGKVSYATVADPAITEVDQLFLGYQGLPANDFKYGRQRLQLDNERYIGNVGWRQIEQTFDATTWVNHSLPQTTLTVAYLYKIHRVFGDYVTTPAGTFGSRSPLLNLAYSGLPGTKVVVYDYLVDLTTITTPLLPAYQSTRSRGLRLSGSQPLAQATHLLYTAEAALQSNGLGNDHIFEVHYSFYEAGIDSHGFSLKLSREQLGSNGQVAFQTPLATLHTFNGWADMFLQTPQAGLVDRFVTLGSTCAQTPVALIYHDFRADQGGAHFGSEIDAQVTHNFGRHYVLGAALGAYHNIDLIKATAYAPATPSTTKAWIWAEVKL